MLSGFAHLALEVKYLDRARAFYVDRLGLVPTRESTDEFAFDIGETTLLLRRPSTIPRGGLHTHYAFSTTETAYDAWNERLAALDPIEHTFGSYRSLYLDDPDDHCVEIGGVERDTTPEMDDERRRADTPGLTGIFEVVLEVADLDRATARYRTLGFEVVDRGTDRRRVRLGGPVDLELWEPQLGLADARGGVHVDLGFYANDPARAVEALDVCGEPVAIDGGYRVREADGHALTFVEP